MDPSPKTIELRANKIYWNSATSRMKTTETGRHINYELEISVD